MWVRGLKRDIAGVEVYLDRSHPMWVRGLKLDESGIFVEGCLVAPYVGAWIETPIGSVGAPIASSHPMWVRGLKPIQF